MTVFRSGVVLPEHDLVQSASGFQSLSKVGAAIGEFRRGLEHGVMVRLTTPQHVFQFIDAVDEVLSIGCRDLVAQYLSDPAPQGVSLSPDWFQLVTCQGKSVRRLAELTADPTGSEFLLVPMLGLPSHRGA